jgi:hypothetical protein
MGAAGDACCMPLVFNLMIFLLLIIIIYTNTNIEE